MTEKDVDIQKIEAKIEGIQEGVESGLKQGIEKGSFENTIAMAKKMIASGKLTLEDVADFTCLSIDKVTEIYHKMNKYRDLEHKEE